MDNKAHLWRAWWKERVEPKIPVLHSLQMRLALGYSALIAALLILMNTYPLLMSQNLMFRSQQTALANQAVVITNALTTADQLTPGGGGAVPEPGGRSERPAHFNYGWGRPGPV